MDKVNGVQAVVIAFLSSGVVAGIVTLITKRVSSPESKNDLARVGSEFAQLLLDEARKEREELRATIDRLEKASSTQQQALERLQKIANEKDVIIAALEERQFVVARKIQLGQKVTVFDIFGPSAPNEFISGFDQKEKNDE